MNRGRYRTFSPRPPVPAPVRRTPEPRAPRLDLVRNLGPTRPAPARRAPAKTYPFGSLQVTFGGERFEASAVDIRFSAPDPDVRAACAKVEAGISFEHYPIPIAIALQVHFCGVHVVGMIRVRPRENPRAELIPVRHERCFTVGQLRGLDSNLEHALLRKVREVALELVRHELDEWLLFEGRRVFDPHAGNRLRV